MYRQSSVKTNQPENNPSNLTSKGKKMIGQLQARLLIIKWVMSNERGNLFGNIC